MGEPEPTPGARGPHARSWPDTWSSLALGLAAAVLYGLTLCPTVSWYDSAEFSASAAALRVVPHPPGYPLYTIIGHGFTWLPGEAAWGMNVMSAVFWALCVVLLHRVVLRLPLPRPAAVVPPLLLAVAPSVWANAVVAEVYTPGLAFLLGALLLCQRARDRNDPRWAWAGAAVAGAGLGVHMSVATWGLGFVVLVGWASWPRLQRDPRATAARWGLGCLLAAGLGASVLLLVQLGPFDTVTPLGPYEDSFSRMWTRFTADVQGGVFRRYFKPMPVGDRLLQIGGIVHDNLGTAGLLAAAGGVGWSALRARVLASAFALGAVGNVGFFFRYDVPDLDVFLLPTIVSLVVFAGWGVTAAFQAHRRLGLLVSAALVSVISGGAIGRYPTSTDPRTGRHVHTARRSVPRSRRARCSR